LILFIIILINEINTSNINIKSTTAQSIFTKVAGVSLKTGNDLKKNEKQLKNNREKFEEEKKQMQKNIKNTDVIRLNVGGEIMMTTRQTLTRIPKSILAIIFNGRWEHKLHKDKKGYIFLDFNPIIFRHLLDQLQLFDTTTFSLPSDPSLILPFKKMVRKLGLNHLLSSEKNIITFNVDGKIMTNQRKTFDQISNSTFDTIVSPSKSIKFNNKSDVFIDYDPKLFQHLINQLREESFNKKSCLKALSDNEKISFNRMLNDLNISRK
jgi:hypothetical protein